MFLHHKHNYAERNLPEEQGDGHGMAKRKESGNPVIKRT